MLDRLIAAGQVDSLTIRAIAKRIAEFHSSVSSNRGWTYGAALSIRRDVIEDIGQNKQFVGHALRKDQFTAIDAFCREFVNSHRRALNERALDGRVREGHGDLRSEHICLVDNEIDVIDCVEFSEHLRYSNVASEIAFLAMDLERLGAPQLAGEEAIRRLERRGSAQSEVSDATPEVHRRQRGVPADTRDSAAQSPAARHGPSRRTPWR